MSELDAIRAQRLAQLQQASGSSSGGQGMQLPAGMRPAGGPSGQDAEEQQAKQQQEDEMRRTVMNQVLQPEARERLSRIALVRPSTARQIEDLLVRLAKGGQLKGQVGDAELKGLLEQVSAEPKPIPSSQAAGGIRGKSLGQGITIQRKRDDSDSDEYDL